MGNSEVGHLNLGAGAIVKQDLARIDDAIADGSFFENEALLAACERARASPRGRLHLLGLVSDGGVHSGWEHLEACIELAAQEGVPDVVFHAFTDGRDTLPHGGRGYLARARALAAPGRPDRHRQRPLLRDGPRHAAGSGPSSPTTRSSTPRACARRAPPRRSRAAYERGETDEFVKPTVIGDYDGIADGDVAIFVQLPPRPGAADDPALGRARLRRVRPRRRARGSTLTTMTEYRKGWPYPVAFPPRRGRRRRSPR